MVADSELCAMLARMPDDVLENSLIIRYGSKEWWLDGKLHRLDGPAVENPNGNNEWYVNGCDITVEERAVELFLPIH